MSSETPKTPEPKEPVVIQADVDAANEQPGSATTKHDTTLISDLKKVF